MPNNDTKEKESPPTTKKEVDIVRTIKGNNNDKQVETDDNLENKIIELVQIKQKKNESAEMYKYHFDTCAEQVILLSLMSFDTAKTIAEIIEKHLIEVENMEEIVGITNNGKEITRYDIFDKTDIDEISHEAETVEYTSELEKPEENNFVNVTIEVKLDIEESKIEIPRTFDNKHKALFIIKTYIVNCGGTFIARNYYEKEIGIEMNKHTIFICYQMIDDMDDIDHVGMHLVLKKTSLDQFQTGTDKDRVTQII
ncbi:hypothetical protein C2G38_2174932 [Gigaspora rosea]|uniref:Uncharacterized protein n=1 Tax=Gigaspora rosea TaxID=44941 RepID=A0A397VHT0_9GLOM|nr:hypothetical protein C2G38_2174932 [Gigaspora rosea]